MADPTDPPAPNQRLPAWITAELQAEAREVFQPYYEQDLTPGDILDLLQNLGGVFEILYGDLADDDGICTVELERRR